AICRSCIASGHPHADNNSVRKTTAALIVIGLIWVSYLAWPLYQLTVLVRVIEAHDVATVVHYVNFDRVRASLTEQIASAYVQMSFRSILALHSRQTDLQYQSRWVSDRHDR